MILAAGLGTRLQPLTHDRPKALVEIGGRTLVQITLERLRSFGVREVIVNTHHFADQMQQYLAAHANFGMRIEVSREDELLDTGGGLKRAEWFFLDGAKKDEPFLVHNVDVLSTINLGAMLHFHREHNALATLAMQDRSTSRYLLFDSHDLLCGRRVGSDGTPQIVRPADDVHSLAFAGIHIVSTALFARLSENGAFSIIDAYLRLAAAGERVAAFRADAYYWRDLGKPESIAQAARDIESGLYPGSITR